MPPLDETGLRDCQIDAITGLEASLAEDKPRSLIQMATGAGKTFTACTFSWRLIKHAGARRILFLVDRNNLGDQTLKEYQNYQPPGPANRSPTPTSSSTCTATASTPTPRWSSPPSSASMPCCAAKSWTSRPRRPPPSRPGATTKANLRPVAYNPAIPIETFDFIVTDECHRSIYGLWRQVLEYFDAHTSSA
jgi:type I restriction enzyme, R subunit